MFLGFISEAADIVTVFGFPIAFGCWVLYRFVISRQRHPHASVKHEVQGYEISHNDRLLHICMTVTNTGSVCIRIKKLSARLAQISPCENKILDNLKIKKDSKTEGDWPEIGYSEQELEECFIEPGEHELFDFDFLISKSIELVSVYTHVENRKKSPSGWSHSTWHKYKDLVV